MTTTVPGVITSADVVGEPVVLTYRATIAMVEAPSASAPAETALEEARRHAFEAGSREGRARAAAELAEQVAAERAAVEEARAAAESARTEAEAERAALVKLLASVQAALDKGIEGAEEACVEIAFAAACRVVGQAALGDQGLRGLIREALRELRNRERAVVRLASADYARLAGDPARLRELADELGVQLAADERVTLGGCLIETAGGTLDARLEVQLRQLADALVQARGAGER